jgi:hypothetical protein
VSSRAGWLALWASLGHAAFALRARRVFLALGPVPVLPEGAGGREALAALVLGVAVVLGLLALRRTRGRDPVAVVALALAAPFVVDALVAPLTRALGPGAAGRWIFIATTEAALVGLLWAGRAAWPSARSPPRRARAQRVAGRRGRSSCSWRSSSRCCSVRAWRAPRTSARAATATRCSSCRATSAACRSRRSRSSAPSG